MPPAVARAGAQAVLRRHVAVLAVGRVNVVRQVACVAAEPVRTETKRRDVCWVDATGFWI